MSEDAIIREMTKQRHDSILSKKAAELAVLEKTEEEKCQMK